jgi:hypothetical protein
VFYGRCERCLIGDNTCTAVCRENPRFFCMAPFSRLWSFR